MPITLTLSEGLLTPEAQSQAFADLTHALLDVSGLEGNAFMEPNTVGTLHILPANHVFSGGSPVAAAFVELKLPSIALTSPESRQAFIERATDVLDKAAGGKLERRHIWANVVYAVDGAWGIAGKSYDNAGLISEIQAAAAQPPA